MPIRTRRELLRLAERYRVPIVEDATYRELYFREAPPPSLRDLDAQNIVIHLNSFSKVLAPGLRLGWLSAAPSIVDQIAIIKQRLDPHTQNLVQFAMAAADPGGSFDAHLQTLRAEHARRCTADDARHPAPRSRRRAAVRAAARRALPVVSSARRASARVHCSIARSRRAWHSLPGHAFYPDPAGESELRMCFSSVTPTPSTRRSGGWRHVSARRCGRRPVRRHRLSPDSQMQGSDQLSAISYQPSALSFQL